MTYPALVFACVLQAVAGDGKVSPECRTAYVEHIADAINRETDEHDVPADVVAAVIWHESRYKQFARGPKHEIGLMQVKRRGAVQGRYLRLSNKNLANIDVNIHLGVAYMAPFAHKCRGPRYWLTTYNGGGCVPSRYSKGVLADLAKGRRWMGRLTVPIDYTWTPDPGEDRKVEMTLRTAP